MKLENTNLFLREDGRLRVGWRFVLAAFVNYLAMFLAGTFAATVAGNHQALEETIYRSLMVVLLLFAFLGMTRVFDQPQGSAWAYIGLPRRNWLRQWLRGAVLGFVLVFVAVIVSAVFFNYHITKIVVSPRTIAWPLAVAFVLLCGALGEELMFRGYPFQRLVEGVGKAGAIVALSALFGALHLGNPHISDTRAVHVFAFINTLLIGVVFAVAYLRTRALWLPWGLHFSWNYTMGLIFGLPVSGITAFSLLIRARMQGPAWFLGGGYGLEGGFLGTLSSLLGLVYVGFLMPATAPDGAPSQLDETAGKSIQPTEKA